MPTLHVIGLLIGLSTFLVIGIFHPIVIKAEYYFGTRPWWVFLLVGVGSIAGSLFIENTYVSALAAVFGFSALWGILELFDQRKRVKKGWFPKGPGHQA